MYSETEVMPLEQVKVFHLQIKHSSNSVNFHKAEPVFKGDKIELEVMVSMKESDAFIIAELKSKANWNFTWFHLTPHLKIRFISFGIIVVFLLIEFKDIHFNSGHSIHHTKQQ